MKHGTIIQDLIAKWKSINICEVNVDLMNITLFRYERSRFQAHEVVLDHPVFLFDFC